METAKAESEGRREGAGGESRGWSDGEKSPAREPSRPAPSTKAVAACRPAADKRGGFWL